MNDETRHERRSEAINTAQADPLAMEIAYGIVRANAVIIDARGNHPVLRGQIVQRRTTAQRGFINIGNSPPTLERRRLVRERTRSDDQRRQRMLYVDEKPPDFAVVETAGIRRLLQRVRK